jgi:YD repeat-containing protein
MVRRRAAVAVVWQGRRVNKLLTHQQPRSETSAIQRKARPLVSWLSPIRGSRRGLLTSGCGQRTHYNYELISGNVTQVTYQKDSTDQFIHQYQYDQDNRLKEVHTSKDNTIWDRDAKYFYYKHGPLARTERGEYMVQGEDFTYTINGWIKGYNSATLDTARDMGKDGGEAYSLLHNNLHRLVARDSLGWVLGYYDGDYTAISHPATAYNFEPVHTGTDFSAHTGQLYNGNIRHLAISIGGMDVLGTTYRYDQLHRLKRAETFTGLNVAGNTWSGASDVFSWGTS